MQEMSATTWHRRGSSIVFERDSLGKLINQGVLISLRQALGWMNIWPVSPPGNGQTVLVSGLETILDLFQPAEAEKFLKKKIKPFIYEFQSRWDQCGLVFGFSAHERSFVISEYSEEVLFKRRDYEQIHLSHSLWDGSSTMNITRLVRHNNREKNTITVGYYVSRIS